jgi:threonine/homoserine/homoserine lactone efflux protein
MILYILRGITLGFSAAITPGPYQAYLLSETMASGWKRTLPATLAPLITDGPIIALVLLVLTRTPEWFVYGLQFAGGIFILYLAWGAYQTFQHIGTALPDEPSGQSLLKAIFVNFLNPAPYLFWSTVGGPTFLAGWWESKTLGLSFLGSFYGSFLLSLVGLVTLFALARRSGPSVVKVLLAISVVALLLLALYQMWSGLTGTITLLA